MMSSNQLNNAETINSISDVIAAIQSCYHYDATIREPAEAKIRAWEVSSDPGYFSHLLSIVENGSLHNNDLRMLTAILAKNAVPKVWRWSVEDEDNQSDNDISDETRICNLDNEKRRQRKCERNSAREKLTRLLFAEVDDRVALHLRLAVANVAAFDFPSNWPSLIQDLGVHTSTNETLVNRIRAIKALRDVFQATRHRKIIIKSPGAARSLVTIQAISQKAKAEREKTADAAIPAFKELASQSLQHVQATMFAGPGWSQSGALAVAYLKCLVELIPMVLHLIDLKTFLENSTLVLKETRMYPISFPPNMTSTESEGVGEWNRPVDKIFRATLRCLIFAMDAAPTKFAPYLSSCLQSVLEGMLGLDIATLHNVPTKRLVLQAQFINHVVSTREYNSMIKAPQLPPQLLQAMGATMIQQAMSAQNDVDTTEPGIVEARQAVTGLLSEGLCEKVVEALVTKFLRLTKDEILEWENDAEGYFQTEEAERTAMEADTPRICGKIVLRSMMERGSERAGQALLTLARHCSQQQDFESLINREACYHSLQICSQWMPSKGLNFSEWWMAELRILLQTNIGPESPFPIRTLQSRGVQLLFVYVDKLDAQEFEVAFQTTTNLLQSVDVVTALNAARCLGHLAMLPLERGAKEDNDPYLVAIKAHSVNALGNAFALANQVSSDDSLRTALMLVSRLVEANGKAIEHCLHAIAEQLPPLWERAEDSVSIHSCLIAVLSHLIMKLGYPAVENPHVQKVLFPLIDYCTDVSVSHRIDALMEDGLKLWLVVLLTSRLSTMSGALTAMTPRLEIILKKKLEPHLSLQIAQLYSTLYGPQILEALGESLPSLLVHCVSCMFANEKGEETMSDEKSNQTDSNGGTKADCLLALTFIHDSIQLFPSFAYPLCQPIMVRILQSVMLKPHPHALVEAFFVALSRMLWNKPSILEEAFASDAGAASKISSLVRLWVRILSSSSLASLLNPEVGIAEFVGRKGAALSLCSAVCKSSFLAQVIGHEVVKFTKSLEKVEKQMNVDLDTIVDVSCGSVRQTLGDGPLGDIFTRMREILKTDPLVTISLNEAVENASNAIKHIPEL